MTETIQQLKEDIAILQEKLQKLEELSQTKSPAEEAFKEFYGAYPITDIVDTSWDSDGWVYFEAGYNAAYQKPEENEWKLVALKLGEKLSDVGPDGYYEFSADEWFEWVIDECLTNEVKRLQEKEWKSAALRFGEKLVSIGPCGYYDFTPEEWFEWVVNTYEKLCDDTVNLLKKETAQERGERLHKDVERCVSESVKWCEENPDKDPLDWLKPQTPEETEQSLKEAFREAVKQGVVSSTTKPQTLTDLIYDWWGDVFTTHSDWDMETSIANLVDEISLWLPTEHCTNSYKWNACIRMIREKLR